ncbi:MAG: phospholipid carrier-dependent glycosyltransferase [Chloroflexota bacterium]
MKAFLHSLKGPLEWMMLVALLSFFYLGAIERVRFHGDESQWIATSLYLETALDATFSPPAWLTETPLTTNQRDEELKMRFPSWAIASLGDMQAPNGVWDTYYWTLTQPPVVRYVIGASRLLNGYTAASLNTPWDFDANHAENARQGNWPSDGLLYSTRRSMAVLSIVSGVILFGLVRQSAGATAGWCFAFLYALSGYLLTHLRRAMGDAPLLFFTCLAMLAGMLALRAWDRIRKNGWQASTPKQRILPLAWLAGMGIAAGLAGAAKMNGLGIALAGVLLSGAMAYGGPGLAARRTRLALALGGSALVMGLCTATFVGVNPFLYPNPPARTAAMFTLRTWEMDRNQRDPRWGMPTLGQRLQTVSWRVLEDYTVFHFGVINVPLACIGLAALLYAGRQWLVNRGGPPAAPVLLAVGCVTVLPALTTPLDWDRYYLYPVIFLSVLIALGLGQGIHFIARKVREAETVTESAREF